MNELLNASPSVTDFLPAGTIIPFAGNVELKGWSLCDGGELSRTEYSNLFNMIGTIYGEGDGSTTFNKPNLINKFLEGSNVAGVEINAGLPNITGYLGLNGPTTGKWWSDNGYTGALYPEKKSRNDSNASLGSNPDITNAPYNTISFDASKSNTIYGKSNTVQPPSVTIRYLIKL